MIFQTFSVTEPDEIFLELSTETINNCLGQSLPINGIDICEDGRPFVNLDVCDDGNDEILRIEGWAKPATPPPLETSKMSMRFVDSKGKIFQTEFNIFLKVKK